MAALTCNHLLTMNEYWFAKEHPFDVSVVKVRRLMDKVLAAENELNQAREDLDRAVAVMNGRMATTAGKGKK